MRHDDLLRAKDESKTDFRARACVCVRLEKYKFTNLSYARFSGDIVFSRVR